MRRAPESKTADGRGLGEQLGLPFEELAEHRDDARIELRSRFALELGERLRRIAALAIRAIVGDRVEGVDHRQDARAERNVLSTQAEIARIGDSLALSVPALLVVLDQGQDIAQDLDVAQDLETDLHMLCISRSLPRRADPAC